MRRLPAPDAVPVADCTFTSQERKRIDAISFDLSDVVEEYFADARETLSEEDWQLLADYAKARINRVLELVPLLHALVDRQRDALPYPGRGRATFVRSALTAWRDSFSPIEDTWRLAPVLLKIEGGEQRVMADVAALELVAVDRLMHPWEEQCAALLSSKE